MNALPKKIAVLMGGPGSERDVSLATARGVAKALRSRGAEVFEIDVRDENFELPRDIDLAFLAIHGTFGEDGTIQGLLELADSQITYRLRYVMVAARAPVIDLVALDPNNPRSIVYQLARIETHLAAVPRRGMDGRLSPPEQIASALATRMRTAEAASIDENALIDAENALMRLSDVIGSTYFTSHERTEAPWEALE